MRTRGARNVPGQPKRCLVRETFGRLISQPSRFRSSRDTAVSEAASALPGWLFSRDIIPACSMHCFRLRHARGQRVATARRRNRRNRRGARMGLNEFMRGVSGCSCSLPLGAGQPRGHLPSFRPSRAGAGSRHAQRSATTRAVRHGHAQGLLRMLPRPKRRERVSALKLFARRGRALCTGRQRPGQRGTRSGGSAAAPQTDATCQPAGCGPLPHPRAHGPAHAGLGRATGRGYQTNRFRTGRIPGPRAASPSTLCRHPPGSCPRRPSSGAASAPPPAWPGSASDASRSPLQPWPACAVPRRASRRRYQTTWRGPANGPGQVPRVSRLAVGRLVPSSRDQRCAWREVVGANIWKKSLCLLFRICCSNANIPFYEPFQRSSHSHPSTRPQLAHSPLGYSRMNCTYAALIEHQRSA